MPLSNAQRQARFRARQTQRLAASNLRPDVFRPLLNELVRRREVERRRARLTGWKNHNLETLQFLQSLEWAEAQLKVLASRPRYVTEAALPSERDRERDRKSPPMTNAQRQAQWRQRQQTLNSRYVTEGGVPLTEVQRLRQLIAAGLKEAGAVRTGKATKLGHILGNRLKSALAEVEARLARFAECPNPADLPLPVLATQVPAATVLRLRNEMLRRRDSPTNPADNREMLGRLDWLHSEIDRIKEDRYITEGGVDVYRLHGLMKEIIHKRTWLESAFTPPGKRRGLYPDRIPARELADFMQLVEQRLASMLAPVT